MKASPAVLADGSIGCVSRYGMFCYASPEGVVKFKYNLTGYTYGSPKVGPSAAIYVTDYGVGFGGLTALRAGASLAHTPWPKFRGNTRNTGNILDAAP
jgi:hypothetical protein